MEERAVLQLHITNEHLAARHRIPGFAHYWFRGTDPLNIIMLAMPPSMDFDQSIRAAAKAIDTQLVEEALASDEPRDKMMKSLGFSAKCALALLVLDEFGLYEMKDGYIPNKKIDKDEDLLALVQPPMTEAPASDPNPFEEGTL